MIEVESLRKTYAEIVAVDGVSFRCEPGRIFGLLGPNGAGKSTTIGCISGLVAPSGGTVRVLGHDVVREGPRSRERLGVVPQDLALYEDLSARENLSYWGAAYGLGGSELRQRVDRVLADVELADRAKEPAKQLSGGMKRRLNFGAAIVHRPDVLLLDEPTVGVDPQSRVKLIDLIRAETGRGTTVLYTTHYMEEAEAICDDIAIIDHGAIIARGTLAELRDQLGERDILRVSGDLAATDLRSRLDALGDVDVVSSEGDTLTLAVRDATKRLPEVLGALTASGGTIRETTLTRPSLESLFIKLTGKELRE